MNTVATQQQDINSAAKRLVTIARQATNASDTIRELRRRESFYLPPKRMRLPPLLRLLLMPMMMLRREDAASS